MSFIQVMRVEMSSAVYRQKKRGNALALPLNRKDLLDGLTFCIHLQNAKWDALHDFAIAADVYGVDAGMLETQTLQIEDQVAGQERNIWWQSDVEFWLDRHVVRVESVAILVDDVDGKLVTTGVFRSEAKAQSQGAMRMHDGKSASGQSVKHARNHQFALVVGSEVSEGSNLNVHDMLV